MNGWCSGQGKQVAETKTGLCVCPVCGRTVKTWGIPETVGRHKESKP